MFLTFFIPRMREKYMSFVLGSYTFFWGGGFAEEGVIGAITRFLRCCGEMDGIIVLLFFADSSIRAYGSRVIWYRESFTNNATFLPALAVILDRGGIFRSGI